MPKMLCSRFLNRIRAVRAAMRVLNAALTARGSRGVVSTERRMVPNAPRENPSKMKYTTVTGTATASANARFTTYEHSIRASTTCQRGMGRLITVSWSLVAKRMELPWNRVNAKMMTEASATTSAGRFLPSPCAQNPTAIMAA